MPAGKGEGSRFVVRRPEPPEAEREVRMSDDDVEQARRWFAEELRLVARVEDPRVVDAFASVPRERFVGPGPLRILSFWNMKDYWTPPDVGPAAVYHDVLIAYDEQRRLNNGQPSLWAFVFDKLGVARWGARGPSGLRHGLLLRDPGRAGRADRDSSGDRDRRTPGGAGARGARALASGHRRQRRRGRSFRGAKAMSSSQAPERPIHCRPGSSG